ncbi:MFS transporter [Candidimonas humi]|uniref:MFS transporter n=1 Tax=Candidimonas humi TaxID=683355 RepID=A0ABV8P063_9BURK|nr:MFS transporter [Candidimonas humi]MBV6306736.1 MFS transporter [Candidimonas humi]
MSSGNSGIARYRRTQRVLLALLVAIGMVNVLDRSALSIANHVISQELHLSPVQMGLLLSVFSWVYAFAQLPTGALLDRIGTRVVLGAGLFLWSVAQLGCGLVSSLQGLIWCRLGLGLGEAPTFPAGAKLLAQWYGRKDRGTATGVFLASPTIGPMLAPPILTGLLLAFGWRSMFVILGVVGIVLMGLWFYATPRHAPSSDAFADARPEDADDDGEAERKLSWADWRGLFVQRTTWGVVLGFVGVIYMIWLYLTWLPGYLEHQRHLSIANTGWVMTIPYFFGAVGSICSGRICDRLAARGMSLIKSRKWPICIGLLASACFTVPMIYASSTTWAIIYLCATMFFLYFAGGGAWALVNVAAPKHLVASLGSLQNFGGYFGGSFAPVLTGWMVQRTHSFSSSLLLSAIVAIAAALIYALLVGKPIHSSSDT